MHALAKNICKKCGAIIPSTSPARLCPACLLTCGLEPLEGETAAMSPRETLLRYGPTRFPHCFGDYRLWGLLGRGGMGTVYDAKHLLTGRRVALKMLGQTLDSSEMRQRFLREGRLAASVNHPNSLYIFGCEEIDDLPVITMEVASGGTLQDQLKQRGPLPVPQAVDAILDVMAGLEAAHQGGILHRDIKPSNCFVVPDGSVKVGDFGLSVSTLASHDTFVTAYGRIMGTPAFAAPEQLRGDPLDIRTDIYSVGATLYTLLTNQTPFKGDNAIQVVANAINQKPRRLTELRSEVPPGLERAVNRCLSKTPEGRYPDYSALRRALLPFSSKEPKPSSLKIRTSAGWIDYLAAFLIPYVTLMLSVGVVDVHLKPVIDHTLFSVRYHLLLIGLGCLYFALTEGLWGAGLGKRLKGLQVIRPGGKAPGLIRALFRILIPMTVIECTCILFLWSTISITDLSQWTVTHTLLYIGAYNAFPWLAVLLTFTARWENGFATVWDLLTGTRVVTKPTDTQRPALNPDSINSPAASDAPMASSIGPYHITEELLPGSWILAKDSVLKRQIWLLRRTAAGLSTARQNLARPGRLRWLQNVTAEGVTWDAFEAPAGCPFLDLTRGDPKLPWLNMRFWLYDLAAELWESSADQTLPSPLSLAHIWITTQGQAVLLDQPWPAAQGVSENILVDDLVGQQRFLSVVAAYTESHPLPLHARAVLRNLAQGTFEKLSFLTGILQGLLDKPAQVSRGIRAACIFMIPCYVWVMAFIGYYQEERLEQWHDSLGELLILSVLAVLSIIAVAQLFALPWGSTASQSVFRLAIVNNQGDRASVNQLFKRWLAVWMPLFGPMLLPAGLILEGQEPWAFGIALLLLLLWIAAAVYAVVHPRSLQDRLAGTWVVCC